MDVQVLVAELFEIFLQWSSHTKLEAILQSAVDNELLNIEEEVNGEAPIHVALKKKNLAAVKIDRKVAT